MSAAASRKHKLPVTPPWQRQAKHHRMNRDHESPHQPGARKTTDDGSGTRNHEESFAREQTRINQIQEAEQMREWVAKEDDFVLKQSKKKAQIRVQEGRARSVDWLAVTLGVIDNTRDPLEDEGDQEDLEIIDPSGVFEGIDLKQLQDLRKDIETYLSLESNLNNRKYWSALKIICKDYESKAEPTPIHGRSNASVSADIDTLLSPKSLTQLKGLEEQIADKLQSNESIDVEYWEQLLRSVAVYKAKAELNIIYKSVIESRLSNLRQEQRIEAINLAKKLELLLSGHSDSISGQSLSSEDRPSDAFEDVPEIEYSKSLDPDALLKVRVEDKHLDIVEEEDFLEKAVRLSL